MWIFWMDGWIFYSQITLMYRHTVSDNMSRILHKVIARFVSTYSVSPDADWTFGCISPLPQWLQFRWPWQLHPAAAQVRFRSRQGSIFCVRSEKKPSHKKLQQIFARWGYNWRAAFKWTHTQRTITLTLLRSRVCFARQFTQNCIFLCVHVKRVTSWMWLL